MVLALRANPGAPLHFLAIHDRAAVIALEPEALGNLDLPAVLILRGRAFFLEPRHGGVGLMPAPMGAPWPSSGTRRLGRGRCFSSASMTGRYDGLRGQMYTGR